MKTLILTKKFPYPLNDGESIAVVSLARAMAHQGVEVHLLSMNTSKDHYDGPTTPSTLAFFKSVTTVDIDNRLTVSGLAKAYIRSESYHISRFVSQTFETKLVDLLSSVPFDVIQLESVFLYPYRNAIRECSNAKLVLRSHNVEHLIWERIANNESNILKRIYLQYAAKKLKQYETATLSDIDLLLPMSDADEQQYLRINTDINTQVIGIGLELSSYDPIDTIIDIDKLSFIGSLDWLPNQQGLLWFLDKAWPLIHQKFPNMQCHIAGKKCPQNIYTRNNEQIKVHGEVDDASQFMRNYPIMIVPLLAGSGLRVKILEAMALGVIVISTTIGTEGIGAIDGTHLYIADSPEMFLAIVQKLQTSEAIILTNMSKNARVFVQENFSSDALATHLINKYEELIVE